MNGRTIAVVALVAVGGFILYRVASAVSEPISAAAKSQALLNQSAARLAAGQQAEANRPNLWSTIALTAGSVAASYFSGGISKGITPDPVNV